MNSTPTKIQYILVITRNFSQPAPCESRGSNLNPGLPRSLRSLAMTEKIIN